MALSDTKSLFFKAFILGVFVLKKAAFHSLRPFGTEIPKPAAYSLKAKPWFSTLFYVRPNYFPVLIEIESLGHSLLNILST
jgi:hypothetical protein